jgi:glycerol-3-phosphate acyltransferase PlsY
MTLVMASIALVLAYLIGSIPTALIVARKVKSVDIRCVGDGNMGARNTFHQIGPRFGVLVAVIDFAKGAIPVFLVGVLGLGLGWQILVGISAILGHDFPLFASFRGGQGTATSLGTMLALFPLPTLIGLGTYGVLFLIIRNSNISCGTGGAVIAATLGFSQQWLLFAYAITVFVFIPVKLIIDSPRRHAIGTANGSST